MKLIDRYVYAATERLPADTREDVSLELRANIEDMLPEDPTEDDVRAVLDKLGNPRLLSDEYNQKKRYLIGPNLYDGYFSVLKLVMCIVSIVFVFMTLLEWCLNPTISNKISQMPISFILDIMTAPLEGILQAFLWVTIVFILLERSGVTEGKMPFIKKKWSPDDLPDVPISKKSKISRLETIFSMFCTVLFTALVYFKSQLIGLYTKSDSGVTLVAPLFANERLHFYIPIILLFAIIQLSIFIWKLISMRWTFQLAVANAIHNVALSVFVCVMLSDTSLFNQELLLKFADFTKTSLNQNTSIWLKGTTLIFIAIFIGINLLDSVTGFVKCKK